MNTWFPGDALRIKLWGQLSWTIRRHVICTRRGIRGQTFLYDNSSGCMRDMDGGQTSDLPSAQSMHGDDEVSAAGHLESLWQDSRSVDQQYKMTTS